MERKNKNDKTIFLRNVEQDKKMSINLFDVENIVNKEAIHFELIHEEQR